MYVIVIIHSLKFNWQSNDRLEQIVNIFKYKWRLTNPVFLMWITAFFLSKTLKHTSLRIYGHIYNLFLSA